MEKRKAKIRNGIRLINRFEGLNILLIASAFSLLNFSPAAAGEEQVADSGASWKIVIAPAEEPGERMVISGAVYASDEKTPLGGIKIYVYHTDSAGYYSKEVNSPRNARLNGTLVTNAEGKYEFETIKPGHYPGGGFPAHVHYVVTRKDGSEQRFELLFEGDPYISDDMKRRGTVEGGYLAVRKLEKDENGIWRGEYDLVLKK